MGASPSWRGRRILISGHRRFETCRAYQFPRGASVGKGPALIRLEWRVRPPYPRPFPAVRKLAGSVVSADHQLLNLLVIQPFENECIALQRQTCRMSYSSNSVVPEGVSEAPRMLAGFNFGIVTRQP
jgi:hypothetical protein